MAKKGNENGLVIELSLTVRMDPRTARAFTRASRQKGKNGPTLADLLQGLPVRMGGPMYEQAIREAMAHRADGTSSVQTEPPADPAAAVSIPEEEVGTTD